MGDYAPNRVRVFTNCTTNIIDINYLVVTTRASLHKLKQITRRTARPAPRTRRSWSCCCSRLQMRRRCVPHSPVSQSSPPGPGIGSSASPLRVTLLFSSESNSFGRVVNMIANRVNGDDSSAVSWKCTHIA